MFLTVLDGGEEGREQEFHYDVKKLLMLVRLGKYEQKCCYMCAVHAVHAVHVWPLRIGQNKRVWCLSFQHNK